MKLISYTAIFFFVFLAFALSVYRVIAAQATETDRRRDSQGAGESQNAQAVASLPEKAPRRTPMSARTRRGLRPFKKISFVVREKGMEDRPISRKALRRLAPDLYRDKVRHRF